MTLRRRRLLQVLPAAGLASCGSAPAQYYRLAPLPGSSFHTRSTILQVRSIGVPSYLNQSGIAEPSNAYQFNASADDLWAEPLPEMLLSVLVENLAQRLPQMTVTGSDGAIGEPPGLVLEVNLLRFDPDASGRITLIAQTALKQPADDRFISARTWQTNALPAAKDMASVMASMSALWAGLADSAAQTAAAIN